MPRRSESLIVFDALAIEGALFSSEWLGKVAALNAPAQSPADYHVPRGLQLRDELGRYWRMAQAIWGDFAMARAGADRSGITNRFVRDLLSQVFGFADLVEPHDGASDEHEFPIAFMGAGGHVPVVVGAHDVALDQSVERLGDDHRRRSAWGLLQEYLNATDGALWGIATNGLTLRIGRDNASLTRPAWLEADIERIFAEERFADFSALWLFLHASRFRPAERDDRVSSGAAEHGGAASRGTIDVHDCPLERWRDAGREEGSRARELLRVGVEAALLALGQGFVGHPANVALREALESGRLTPAAFFNELLRLVYRMIFLITVEERGILHPSIADPSAVMLYADGYGMRRLRDRALRRSAHDRHADLWFSLRPVFASLGRPEGEPALGLPGLGGLFAPEQCAHLAPCSLANHALLGAVFRLAWLREGGVLAKVNWKDMGVEEFGSVYESLLELVPVVSDGGRRFEFAGAGDDAGNARRLSGSYYTPDSLVQQLLDTALKPVVDVRLREHASSPSNAEHALLSMAIVDPACGSGHFLLGAARRMAGHLARLRAGQTPGVEDYRHALRDVVTHCIYGVDRNPMALELARMALWLEAYTPDRALGFLDHHLVCGDALLGLLDLSIMQDGIPDAAFQANTGDDKDVAKVLRRLNRRARSELEQRQQSGQLALDLGARPLAQAFDELDALTDDDVVTVDAKRARYVEIEERVSRSPLALAADCYVGAFLSPKRPSAGETVLTERQVRERFALTATVVGVLEGTLTASHAPAQAARRSCEQARVLHWPLAFPQVFARGGFDVVVGNPPWEVSQLEEEEYFAARAPEIAALTGARRKAAIAALQRERPSVWETYLRDKFVYEASNTFFRAVPRFALSAFGKINTYALFAETANQMTSRAGRAGIVVPTGIATDDSTKKLFSELVTRERLVSLYDFENREGLFPGVHRSYKFCLLTIGAAPKAEFAFFATQVVELEDPRRRFALAPSDFALINPNTRTCPTFRSEYDAELTKKIYRRVPVLIDETKPDGEGNPWGLSFSQGLFNMTSDSGLFLDAPAEGALPLYVLGMVHQFDHRWASYDGCNGEEIQKEVVSNAEKEDPHFKVSPEYWVPSHEVQTRLTARQWNRAWLMVWRRVCRSTDERTLIASVIPRSAVGDNLFVWLFTDDGQITVAPVLLGMANSILVDYIARQKVGGTNFSFYYMRQLPFAAPRNFVTADIAFIVPRVVELTYASYDLTPWARDLGYDGPPFPWNPGRRAVLRAELDAWYAHLYGLTREELRYILDPADVMGPDYPSETFRVLKNNEEREFGEYRTRRLVLEAWDRLFGA